MLPRTTAIFGACGFIVAILLGIMWVYLTGHTSINPSNAPFLSGLTDWLWPSNLMLMTWHSRGTWDSALGLAFSAVANGIIYALVGAFVGAAVLFSRNRKLS